MRETYVRLLCPRCSKHWTRAPSKLPMASESFNCPDCGRSGTTAEFTRTAKDLEVLQELQQQ